MSYTYKNSGVDLKKTEILGNLLSKKVETLNLNSFAPLFKLQEFSLAATTDGIGTKIIPLIERKMFKTMALDLAAMNLNDLACTGAKPLFFLDYIAANTLKPDEISNFIEELNKVLLEYNCLLLGGETSEMGNFIQKNTFDAAGFVVGIVQNENIVNPLNVKENDVVIALKSSGVHSNGFSLIRKIFSDGLINEKEYLEALEPTVIYSKEILKVTEKKLASSLANITGGGILLNLKRAIPKGFQAVLDRKKLPEINIFQTLKKYINEDEMFKTFNMGAGFCIVAPEKNTSEILDIMEKYEPFIFGKIEKCEDEKRCRFKN